MLSQYYTMNENDILYILLHSTFLFLSIQNIVPYCNLIVEELYKKKFLDELCNNYSYS